MDKDRIEHVLAQLAATLPPLITTEQAAAIGQDPVSTVWDWSSRGLLNGFKIRRGRRLLFERDAYIRWRLTPD